MWRIVLTLALAVVLERELQTTAGLSLSTPTGGAQCYGDTVILVCTHPVLPHVPEFPQGDVGWSRDSGAISTIGLGRSKLNSTNTRLQFAITEDTIGNYTCFLVNSVQGGIKRSNSVSVSPPEPQPPSSVKILYTCPNTSIAFNWTHTPVECYKDWISYYVSWVNIDNNTENGSDVTGGQMYNISGLVANSNYTISVQTVVNGTNAPYSDPISMNATAGCVSRTHTPDDQVHSGKRCLHHKTTSTSEPDCPNAAATIIIATVISVVIIILVVTVRMLIITIYTLRYYSKKISQKISKTPESGKLDGQELVNFQRSAHCQAIRDQPQTSPQRVYADLDFSGGQPVGPPSDEAVTYTEPIAVGLND